MTTKTLFHYFKKEQTKTKEHNYVNAFILIKINRENLEESAKWRKMKIAYTDDQRHIKRQKLYIIDV